MERNGPIQKPKTLRAQVKEVEKFLTLSKNQLEQVGEANDEGGSCPDCKLCNKNPQESSCLEIASLFIIVVIFVLLLLLL